MNWNHSGGLFLEAVNDHCESWQLQMSAVPGSGWAQGGLGPARTGEQRSTTVVVDVHLPNIFLYKKNK